ncbi:MAG TPA: hypothetical protein VGX28_11325 [Frankiaceae bacterium]|nr:hypothetical protein [Frankiaceae bacterium]
MSVPLVLVDPPPPAETADAEDGRVWVPGVAPGVEPLVVERAEAVAEPAVTEPVGVAEPVGLAQPVGGAEPVASEPEGAAEAEAPTSTAGAGGEPGAVVAEADATDARPGGTGRATRYCGMCGERVPLDADGLHCHLGHRLSPAHAERRRGGWLRRLFGRG